MEIKTTRKERHTQIVADDGMYAEFWHQELILYFYLDDSGCDVTEARKWAEFINAAADELERFKKTEREKTNG